jgi:antitoxin component HigA of HigAB toxin-antitoxin module
MDNIIITTEEQNERALAELEELTGKDKHTDRELGYIDRLTAAVEKFEDERYPIVEPSPHDKQLMMDALSGDPTKVRKAMEELNWHNLGDDD